MGAMKEIATAIEDEQDAERQAELLRWSSEPRECDETAFCPNGMELKSEK